MNDAVRFKGIDDKGIAVKRSAIEGLIELDDEDCQVITSSDTYRIKMGFEQASDLIWPQGTPA